jgi:hypothetical protein
MMLSMMSVTQAAIAAGPGGWDATKGGLDNVLISDVTMHNVATPFHFSLKPGNTAGNIIVNRATATGVYRERILDLPLPIADCKTEIEKRKSKVRAGDSMRGIS